MKRCCIPIICLTLCVMLLLPHGIQLCTTSWTICAPNLSAILDSAPILNPQDAVSDCHCHSNQDRRGTERIIERRNQRKIERRNQSRNDLFLSSFFPCARYLILLHKDQNRFSYQVTEEIQNQPIQRSIESLPIESGDSCILLSTFCERFGIYSSSDILCKNLGKNLCQENHYSIPYLLVQATRLTAASALCIFEDPPPKPPAIALFIRHRSLLL